MLMRIIKGLIVAIALFSTSATAQVVQYEATYIIDDICAWESNTDTCGTPVPAGQEWTQIAIGDRFIVRFSVDTSSEDTNDTNTNVSNAVIDGSVREGSYSGILTALSITADPVNTGTYDPSGKVFTVASSIAETLDNVATWVAPPSNLFHEEKIRFLTGVQGATPLSGELTNVSLNFLNYPLTIGGVNLDDLLDDRSVTTDPFPFSALTVDPGVLPQLTDDVVNTAFSGVHPHPFRRPFTMHFGEVIDYDNFGGIDLDDLGDLHVAGALERVRLIGATTPTPTPASGAKPVPALPLLGLALTALCLLVIGMFAKPQKKWLSNPNQERMK